MKKILFILFFSSMGWSCSQPTENQVSEEKTTAPKPETATDTVPESVSGKAYSAGDNSMNSLDWSGTYFATLPCGRCEGIEMWVTLNSDRTFALHTNYLGLNDALEEEFTGKFYWDQTGRMVILEGLKGIYPGKYKVGENRIWYLDFEGKQMSGDLADQYILTKK